METGSTVSPSDMETRSTAKLYDTETGSVVKTCERQSCEEMVRIRGCGRGMRDGGDSDRKKKVLEHKAMRGVRPHE